MSKGSKKDVNKGIRALLANIDSKSGSKNKDSSSTEKIQSTGIVEIAISSIEPNPFQPRTDFDQAELEELAVSIKTHGIIQPLTVRKLSGKKFQIISGERRWRASKISGLKNIPVYVREADDQGMLEMALLENIQRANLNPVEEAISYQRLIDECDLTHEELSDRLGKKRSSITNFLRVLKLAPSVQKALRSRTISLGHAKVLAGIEETEKQTFLLGEILSKGLSIRATEKFLKVTKSSKSTSIPRETDPQIAKMQDNIGDVIGTKIKIHRSDKGIGMIQIYFKSDNELNQIVDTILDK